MGLDQYLEKAKRVGDVTPKQLININEYFGYLNRSNNYLSCSMKEWCGIDIDDVDTSLINKYKREYIRRYASWDTEKKYGWETIFQQITSWRKANHIHKWFVDNVQDGNDDCGMYEVTKAELEDLLDICKEVIAGSKLVKGRIVNGQRGTADGWEDIYEDGEYIEDSSVAEELLPTASGFFFGGTQYDQWYYEDVKHTIEVIEEVLRTTDFEHEIVMYSSSW